MNLISCNTGNAQKYDNEVRSIGTFKGTIENQKGIKPDTLINQKDKQGRKQGLWKEYYPNGKVKEISTYLNDSLNGTYYSFFENGSKQTIIQYYHGKRNGDDHTYFHNGQLESYSKNILGKWDYYEQYDSLGTLIEKDVYKNGKFSWQILYNGTGYDTLFPASK
jgi:antitoxin component YwqK of YwqJK toxin-antitoxin module